MEDKKEIFILISIIAIAILAILLFSGSSIGIRKDFWFQANSRQSDLGGQKKEKAEPNLKNSVSENDKKLTANIGDALPVDLLTKLGEKKVARIETSEKVIALTFDADIYSRAQEEMARKREVSFYDKELISFLEQEKVPATLFLTGFWIEAYPKVTEELAQNSLFEIGNHSYSHPSFIKKCFNMPLVPNSQDREQIIKTEELLKKHAPNFKKYFRFPGLCFDQTDFKIVRSLGYLVIHGDDVGGDGVHKTVSYTVKSVLSQARPGSIVVLHMQGGHSAPSTAQAIPQIVKVLRSRGFHFVTVSQLLRYSQ